MTIAGAVIMASLFAPPVLGFAVFVRMGRPWLQSAVNAVYIFAACMLALLGLFFVNTRWGIMSEDELPFVLPFAVIGYLLWLMAQSSRHKDDRDS